jgi:hypothetical protein
MILVTRFPRERFGHDKVSLMGHFGGGLFDAAATRGDHSPLVEEPERVRTFLRENVLRRGNDLTAGP